MTKSKLERFAEIKTFSNCIDISIDAATRGVFPLRGNWNKEHFKNDFPIVLELGCGKGEYTIGLAEKYVKFNFIGLDIKGNRIWVGAKHALEKKIPNAAFLRGRIDFIETAFGKQEVSEIWITFPDPHPTKKGLRKRLTCPRFLLRYKNILKPNGVVHLKTDSALLYEYTLEVITENEFKLLDSTNDLYAGSENSGETKRVDVKQIQTYYEKRFLKEGKKINYLKFQF